MKNFVIDEGKPFDVNIRRVHTYLENPENPTADDLIKILKGTHQITTMSNDDSPDFKSLRNTLEAEGYIECQRNWWNGDRVIRPFTLNGVKFKVNDKFCCGGAMKYHLQFEREYENERTNHN